MNQKAEPNIYIVIAQLDRAHLRGEPFGQILLVKHRPELRPLPINNWPGAPPQQSPSIAEPAKTLSGSNQGEAQPTIFEDIGGHDSKPEGRVQRSMANAVDPDLILLWLGERNYDDRSVGYALRRVAESGTDQQVDELLRAVVVEIKKRRHRPRS